MPLTIWNCVLSYNGKSYFSENWLVLPRNYFHTEFRGSNFLLPTFLEGSKWDFPVANLVLATANFELCSLIMKFYRDMNIRCSASLNILGCVY